MKPDIKKGRYLVVDIDEFYPSGFLDDVVYSSDFLAEAEAVLKGVLVSKQGWAHNSMLYAGVFDTQEWVWVKYEDDL